MPLETGVLEVGDVIYDYERYGHSLVRLIVSKVTPKQAIVGTRKVLRAIEMQSVWYTDEKKPIAKWVGEYGFAEVETPNLKERYRFEQLIKKAKGYVRNIDDSLITHENASLIISALKSFQKPKQ